MTEPLPHQVKLAEFEFPLDVMRNTDAMLKNLANTLEGYNLSEVQADLNGLELFEGEWEKLTQAADASLVQVIFNNLSATQKEVMRSLLAEN